MSQSVTVSRTISASQQALWEACSTAAGLEQWQADEARVKGGVGGRIVLRWASLDMQVEVSITRWDPPSTLVLAHRDNEVRFDVEDERLTVTQRGPMDADELEGSRSGWTVALATLAHARTHHMGKARDPRWLVQPTQCTVEQAHFFFSEPIALESWLGRTTSGVLTSGSPLAIQAPRGLNLTGTVLANQPGRDVCLSWSELGDAVLTFRTLPLPEVPNGRLLIAQLSVWESVSQLAAAEEWLRGGLLRLGQLLRSGGVA